MSASPFTTLDLRAMPRVRARAGAVLLATVTVAVGACGSSGDAAEPEATAATRPACQVALPAVWQQAFAESRIDAGGASIWPLAVGPAGELAARRDDGDTRDLVLIGADESVTHVYPLPDPDRASVDVVTMDDRWIVVGLDGNDAYLTFTRIDVIDRHDGSVRTVVENPAAEFLNAGTTLDSLALFADTVYWITRNTERGDDGILRSYDLKTGAVAEVANGVMRDVRATAVGIAWWAPGQNSPIVVRNLAPLPAAVAAHPGIEQDLSTLVTDGTRYAWVIDAAEGGTGIGTWSPDTGLARINTVKLFDGDVRRRSPLHLDGPYVLLDEALNGGSYLSTIVDTRSGALALIRTELVAAGGGSISHVDHGPPGTSSTDPTEGLVRTDALPALSC